MRKEPALTKEAAMAWHHVRTAGIALLAVLLWTHASCYFAEFLHLGVMATLVPALWICILIADHLCFYRKIAASPLSAAHQDTYMRAPTIMIGAMIATLGLYRVGLFTYADMARTVIAGTIVIAAIRIGFIIHMRRAKRDASAALRRVR
ncbi:hypothetical protein C4552_02325 [Candidatus Parcubacteria bacterium]|nr:MAG: hypothetical protein C4552_02325 [Candidatus Parcubacteria bacterium]